MEAVQLGDMRRRRRFAHRQQQQPVDPAPAETAQQVDAVLHQPVPADHVGIVAVLVQRLMDAVHDRAGELALEIVAGDPDAAAFAGLHALDHRVGLVAVLTRDFLNPFAGGEFDSGMAAKRLGDGGFRHSADPAYFFHRNHFSVSPVISCRF